jgi:hypothetical protein
MDPITIAAIVRLHQQEISEAPRDDGKITIQKMVGQLGDVLSLLWRNLLPAERESQPESNALDDCSESQALHPIGEC